MATKNLELLHEACCCALEHLKALFRNPGAIKATVILRNPELADGDTVIGDDNYDEVIACIQRMKTRKPIIGKIEC